MHVAWGSHPQTSVEDLMGKGHQQAWGPEMGGLIRVPVLG